jgi:hypothetical protein
MSWNYRIVRDVQRVGDEEHESFSIREVYYDDDGKITGWTAEPCCPAGETWVDLVDDYSTMQRAIGLAVVDVSDEKNPVELTLQALGPPSVGVGRHRRRREERGGRAR